MTATLEDRLEHILDAIARVKRLTAGVTFGHFEQDGTLQWAVERGLEIISEASRSIPESLKAEYADLPWRRIADLGNRLRHAYHQVDSLIVWKIVTEDLGDIERVATLMKAGFGKDLPQ
jgi:uncharacterized protein with HEPN domain